MIHLLFPVSVIIFSLIIDNWLSNLSFSKIIPSQCFHKDKSFTQDKIISGENLALKKPSLQSSGGPGGLGGDQTNFAPTLAVDGGEFCVRNRSEILRYWSLVCCASCLAITTFPNNNDDKFKLINYLPQPHYLSQYCPLSYYARQS